MEYRQGTFGRIFLLKFDDQDDLLAELRKVAIAERIKVGTIMLIGGMRRASMVTGPREPVTPPDPVWRHFDDAREIIGIGTLFLKENNPVIHLHGAIGRSEDIAVGCIRKDSAVYLVVEAVIAEIAGIDARKDFNEKTGLAMVQFC